jgi:hypothetical protein
VCVCVCVAAARHGYKNSAEARLIVNLYTTLKRIAPPNEVAGKVGRALSHVRASRLVSWAKLPLTWTVAS